MELNKQVCSLELAKRLKELGFKQDSLFYWVKGEIWELWDFDALDEEYGIITALSVTGNFEIPNDVYSACTVAELVSLLPLSLAYDTISLRDISADYLANKLITKYEESKI